MRVVAVCAVLFALTSPADAWFHRPILLSGDSRALGRLDDAAHSIPALWNARHPERPMVNGGAGGVTTKLLLQNLRTDLRNTRPRIVVFLVDVNDYGALRYTPKQTVRNLWRLVTIARQHRRQVFVLSTAPCGCVGDDLVMRPDFCAFRDRSSAFTARVEQLLNAWPRRARVRVLAMRATLWPTMATFLPYTADGLHFNKAGNARVVDFLVHYL